MILYQKEQEFGDDLDVYVQSFVPEVSTMPNLGAISFVKVEI